ncbi:hypothetical protein [Oxynema aestuarii]|jgi:hypothetical protein|uniref:Uncharacterized protein n=1 Tax=Oxynema aestuarii AP17 TaxID=2064643 RepID=A0A6H1TW48_9CYAN|nr:hypothetical protein [Oxynema aestuarii]QIZ69983.1 hypothetical protein HCG48_04825 [Oxynema aestuarii AP17]
MVLRKFQIDASMRGDRPGGVLDPGRARSSERRRRSLSDEVLRSKCLDASSIAQVASARLAKIGRATDSMLAKDLYGIILVRSCHQNERYRSAIDE